MIQASMTKTNGIKLRMRDFMANDECRFCGGICVVGGKCPPMAAAIVRPGWAKG